MVHNGIFSKDAVKPVVIVMYHGIDLVEDTRFNPRFFSVANFERQIAAFKKSFNILNHEDFINNRLSSSRPNMVITFDDGYANNYRYALPVLDKYSAHAYYFITGVGTMPQRVLWADAVDIVSVLGQEGSVVSLGKDEFVLKNGNFWNEAQKLNLKKAVKESALPGYSEKEQLIDQLLCIYNFQQKKDLADYWELMTDDEICAASRSKNITIGSHGFYHNNLGSLSTANAVDEVMLSKKYLEQTIQKEVTSIAFPDGSYNTSLNDALYSNGITCQYLVDYRYNDAGQRSYTFDRFGLYPGMGNQHELVYKILKS